MAEPISSFTIGLSNHGDFSVFSVVQNLTLRLIQLFHHCQTDDMLCFGFIFVQIMS
jgi:hypothetical protein